MDFYKYSKQFYYPVGTACKHYGLLDFPAIFWWMYFMRKVKCLEIIQKKFTQCVLLVLGDGMLE